MTAAVATGPRQRRGLRTPLLLLTALLVVTLAAAALATRGRVGRLDPDSYDPDGSHALAQLLSDAGVRVDAARDVAGALRLERATDGPTLLVTDPNLLPGPVLRRIADGAAVVVLIAADREALDVAAPGIRRAGDLPVRGRHPDCGLPAVMRAGRVDVGGAGYEPDPSAGPDGRSLCYRGDGGAALARVDQRTVLGTDAPLLNRNLGRGGNAALSMSLLGERPELIWFRPQLDDPALAVGGHRPLSALLPRGLRLALVQLAAGLVVLALWRGRRLGPVVTEPLPVVVRAAETTEGLARLYSRARARERAADALRGAALRRIAPRFGAPGLGADPRALTGAVAARTGRRAEEVERLLHGAPPVDDAALVALANALDELEASVRVIGPDSNERPRRD